MNGTATGPSSAARPVVGVYMTDGRSLYCVIDAFERTIILEDAYTLTETAYSVEEIKAAKMRLVKPEEKTP